MKAALHAEEEQRLAALRSFDILDTPREDEFDAVVALTSKICDAPISVINLIDEGRQWFKAEVGLNTRETPLDSSICAHAILQPGLLVVNDTTKDDRLCDNPLVTGEPHLRFYAGALLQTSEGLPIGTVCVLDYRPRGLTELQESFLRLMAAQVMKQFELRRMAKFERLARLEAERLVAENALLLREIDHRVMNSLQLVTSILGMQRRVAKSDESKSHLESARNRVSAIAAVHRQLHSSNPNEAVRSDAFFRRLCEGLRDVAPPSVVSMTLEFDELLISSEKANAFGLIIAELVTNSFKHAYQNDERGPVEVIFKVGDQTWTLRIADRGRGMPPDHAEKGNKGIGMKIIASLLSKLDAQMTVSAGAGAAFTITGPVSVH